MRVNSSNPRRDAVDRHGLLLRGLTHTPDLKFNPRLLPIPPIALPHLGALEAPHPDFNAPAPTCLETPPDYPMSLKRKKLIVLAAWLVFAMASPEPIQGAEVAPPSPAPQSTGSVSGRVQNVVTGQYLNKARVSVRAHGNLGPPLPGGVRGPDGGGDGRAPGGENPPPCDARGRSSGSER